MRHLKFKKTILPTLLIFVLLFQGCYEFDFVNQPYTANPNSFFEVQISISTGGGEWGCIASFGILMPDGWATTDSIRYINNNNINETGYIYLSDSLIQQMTLIDPPPENYHWWVGDGGAYPNGTYIIDFTIFTDNQTGTFFLDYMLGDEFSGLNFKRSNDHLMIIGDPVGCLPEGLTFTNQTEIDNFQVNHPGCTVMAGHVTISGDNITNLDGLDSITCIGGSLKIINNTNLTILSGLDQLDSIQGTLYIEDNDFLTEISGLSNLMYLGRDLRIVGDTLLTTISMTSFENLNAVGRELNICSNPNLASLSGFENLAYIGGDLDINHNNILTSLTGLNNVINIGNDLQISSNNSLINLSGLDNLTSIGGNLGIEYNDALTSLSGLDNITSISGYLIIFSNDALLSLSGLDNITSISGYLYISINNALTSLSGLDNMTSISGYLDISSNNALTSLTGLGNLTSIGGDLSIRFIDALTSLTGLENLTTIPGSLDIRRNPALTSLSGLDNLTSIAGNLIIQYNDTLTSLSGLDNIEAASITDLSIANNSSLSTCEVQSICDYLAAPNGTIEISNNAPGCNSPAQIVTACEGLGIGEEPTGDNRNWNVNIFPNPGSGIITIEFEMREVAYVTVAIFNLTGQQVAESVYELKNPGQHQAQFNVSTLEAGVYYCRLQAGNETITKKFVKVKP